jgi:hypothetical protein
MSPEDKKLLERWLVLIARLRDRDAISADEAGDLRREAWEAVLA